MFPIKKLCRGFAKVVRRDRRKMPIRRIGAGRRTRSVWEWTRLQVKVGWVGVRVGFRFLAACFSARDRRGRRSGGAGSS